MKTEGQATFKRGNWRLQLYWPTVLVSKTEFRIIADNTLRVVRERYEAREPGMYTAAGFAVLGFGLGVDHYLRDQPLNGRDVQP